MAVVRFNGNCVCPDAAPVWDEFCSIYVAS